MAIKDRLARTAQSSTFKLFFLGFLVLCFLVPLTMVRSVIYDRMSYRSEAVADIADSWAGEQKLFGPVLIIPFKEAVEEEYYDHKAQTTKRKTKSIQRYAYTLPEELSGHADVKTETRYRGIYEVPVYTASIKLEGRFEDALKSFEGKDMSVITFGQPYLSIGLQDVRGIAGNIELLWDQKELEILAGSRIKNFAQGVHASVPMTDNQNDSGSFSMRFDVKGIKSFQFLPMGKDTDFAMSSSWPEPSFNGRFLPSERDITPDGFTSAWRTSDLATNIDSYFEQCLFKKQCYEFLAQSYGVSLFQSVDVYQQVERSVKYGILFLALTFFVFFIYEVMKQMRIHPVQYSLVGSALALFFLLLLSLSEHFVFGLSYIIAAASVAILLGYYVAHVMKSSGIGVFFGSLIAGLYAVLYFILQSEDYALMTGSFFLFAVLAVVMIVTRKIDWYALQKQS